MSRATRTRTTKKLEDEPQYEDTSANRTTKVKAAKGQARKPVVEQVERSHKDKGKNKKGKDAIVTANIQKPFIRKLNKTAKSKTKGKEIKSIVEQVECSDNKEDTATVAVNTQKSSGIASKAAKGKTKSKATKLIVEQNEWSDHKDPPTVTGAENLSGKPNEAAKSKTKGKAKKSVIQQGESSDDEVEFEFPEIVFNMFVLQKSKVQGRSKGGFLNLNDDYKTAIAALEVCVRQRCKAKPQQTLAVEYGAVWTGDKVLKPLSSSSYWDFNSEEDYNVLKNRVKGQLSRKNGYDPGKFRLEVRAAVEFNDTDDDDANNMDVEVSEDEVSQGRKTVTQTTLNELRKVVSENDTPWLKAQRELRDIWRCTVCSSNSICFLMNHPETQKEIHVPLNPQIISLWAQQMVNPDPKLKASASYPPRQIKEIDLLLTAATTTKKSRRGPVLSVSETAGASDHPPMAPTVQYITNTYSNSMPLPTTPPSRKVHTVNLKSPLCGFAPQDYCGTGLVAYMTYLQEKYGEFGFLAACESLQTQMVGVDLLGSMTVQDLTDRCNVAYGLALRIIQEYSGWKQSLKKDVFPSKTLLCNGETDL